MRTSLLDGFSTMCTGMRMVRAWSAMARVIAWRIHQVAYVENLNPLRVVELLDRADKTQVAFLDKVEEEHAAAHIALRNRNDETQVCFNKLLLGIEAYLLNAGQAALSRRSSSMPLLQPSPSSAVAATPASIFMARSISSAAVSSGTLPISLQVHAHRVARKHGNRGIGGTTASACTSAGGVHLGQSGNSARLNGFQLFPRGCLQANPRLRAIRLFSSSMTSSAGSATSSTGFLVLFFSTVALVLAADTDAILSP